MNEIKSNSDRKIKYLALFLQEVLFTRGRNSNIHFELHIHLL